MKDFYEPWMRAAITEACHATGRVYPNPAVGAVIVQGETVVARGHTQAPGCAHAEVEAIRHWRAAGLNADAATTLVVTMEPCSTFGRTPPCTQAILESGIKRVVVGTVDPNPKHRGRGIEILRAAGVEITCGILEKECADLNMPFHFNAESGKVLIAGKIATTLDGKIATSTGHSRWITGEEARLDVMRWRDTFPAIAAGAGTILADNPKLTVRLPGKEERSPIRIIFDRRLLTLIQPLPTVYTDQWRSQTILVTELEHAHKAEKTAQQHGFKVWGLRGCGRAQGFKEFRERCASEGILGVYVEGGRNLLSKLLRCRELDYLFAYRAPIWLGDEAAPGPFSGFMPESLEQAFRIESPRTATFGPDQLMHGPIKYPLIDSQS
ncbi:MAG: bifunctional diaminohydroxyphosphoribosylaminopyrimidine deaminase/5-amino-6-(5-phosphoribosylamino)uracil reductase RibD [Verrucomicrobia bacterium]|nr:bifunctional diaminohydroxyphosphoribosylaminopyrimidine deaminase/5-amino-6-(5-phosphoribosylamino)uracil reductase RibD [Verrucomicrobiota bacterium]